MSAGATAAGAVRRALAVRASGTIVYLEPGEFVRLLQVTQSPLVVHAVGGIISANYKYLTSYKGLAFFSKSPIPLDLPSGCELVVAKRFWLFS